MGAATGAGFPPALLRAVQAHLPGALPGSLELVGEGISTKAFRLRATSGAWVVRMSKEYPHPWSWHGGRRSEAALLRALETAGLPVPSQISVLASDDTGSPSAFIEREVGGRLALAEDLTAPLLAPQTGAFLSRLHAVPARWCRSVGVRPGFYLADVQARIQAAAARLGTQQRTAAHEALGELAGAGPIAPVLVHGDFRSEHLYLDGDGALTAVIDFGDAALDDAALDLARLPAEFAAEVLSGYSGDRRGLMQRAAHYRLLEETVQQLETPPESPPRLTPSTDLSNLRGMTQGQETSWPPVRR